MSTDALGQGLLSQLSSIFLSYKGEKEATQRTSYNKANNSSGPIQNGDRPISLKYTFTFTQIQFHFYLMPK